MTFKVGDKVRLNSASGVREGITLGTTYTLTGVDAHGYLRFDDDDGFGRYRTQDEYELVQPTPSLDLLAAMTGKPLKFRSGCAVEFVAYVPKAKPHCQLVLLNPATGNVVTRYANGKGSEEPYDEPGDILLA